MEFVPAWIGRQAQTPVIPYLRKMDRTRNKYISEKNNEI